jgi:phosphotransferase family enzyme
MEATMSVMSAQKATPWTETGLRRYLESLGYRDIQSLREVDLTESAMTSLKGFGYGRPVLLEFDSMGRHHSLVLHTASPDEFGHDRPSDRAASLLLAHHTFNRLPRHVASLDVGAFGENGAMVSLGRSGEFFQITEYAFGELYARNLERARERGRALSSDEHEARALSLYLANIHRVKHAAPALYRRRIRDLVGHGEGIMGLVDSYPAEGDAHLADFLKDLEHRAIDWRWRLRGLTHRLAQVHGDFHPFNILFDAAGHFRLLDRSRGEWGEPADDLTSLSINYLFFALRDRETFSGPMRTLFDIFWNTYLEATSDRECLDTAPPYFAWRGLVVASPVWYPALPQPVRERLYRFIRNVLADTRFCPESVDRYLEAAG